jgi:hypothetical protein
LHAILLAWPAKGKIVEPSASQVRAAVARLGAAPDSG